MKFSSKAALLLSIALLAIAIAAAIQFRHHFGSFARMSSAKSSENAGYVGVEVCAQCHATEHSDWSSSHHALAMAAPTDKTVLGNFDDALIVYHGRRTEFKRDGANYVVRTEDVVNGLQSYRVHATFGAYPIQQYLVDTGEGRIQTLPYAWDSRPRSEGGQRWYHLYDNEDITANDPLHWTKRQQNWNQMCASCHSTNLVRNFDPQTQSYATSYTDINVGCESCHGPGQAHAQFWNRHDGQRSANYDGAAQNLQAHLGTQTGGDWQRQDGQSIAQLVNPANRQNEILVCAACHSRRTALTEAWNPKKPFLDQFIPALLDRDLYFHDGQIDAEVFEYGSFLQSKMFMAGVTCNDCHNPHTGKPRRQGNQLCSTCHNPETFDTPAHHHHAAGTDAAQCVTCHMPERTYMGVDARRDHSFRVPHPELTRKIGAPDVCTSCHEDKSPEWAATIVAGWRGSRPAPDHYGFLLRDLRSGAPGAAERAASATTASTDLPDIVKATLAAELASHPAGAGQTEALANTARSTDPLIRLGAVRGLDGIPDARAKARILAPLLDDPYKAIRVEAARVLAGAAEQHLGPEQRARLQSALEELFQVATDNPDRPETIFMIGNVHLARRDLKQAIDAYRRALTLDPLLPPVYVNLSEAFRALGMDADATQTLKAGLENLPETGVLHHAYGLALIRAGETMAAMPHLRRAVALSPRNARFSYVLGVAQYGNSQKHMAISTLENALARAPHDRDILQALVSYSRATGQRDKEIRYSEKLEALQHP